jgi:type IX secretion system PorP/SprF family membrane protein
LKRLLLLIFTGCLFVAVRAQDIPLFTQKLTNSFLYNPSVAGHTFGSITFSHRRLWSGVLGAPTTNFLSFHTPIARHRFGFGVNFYQDKIGVTENVFGSGAFGYHIRISDNTMLSFGGAAEYNNLRINLGRVDVNDPNDNLLSSQTGSKSYVDFSAGTSYKSKYFMVGASVNRLNALTHSQDTVLQFPAFYSGFLQFRIPLVKGRDVLEPIINYRTLVQGSQQVDAGLYYTFNEVATLGGGYRTGGVINMTASIRINKSVLIGYSRDVYSGGVTRGIGASNEFTIRFDFKDESYYRKTKHARVINTKAMAVRRKTLSTYSHKGSPDQKSKRYKKSIKKNAYKSPNYRMDVSKKLMTNKRKGKKSPSRKRKPVRR